MKFAIVILMLASLGLTGCGKRARFLDPPDANHEPYPKHYPPADSEGTHL